MSSPNTYKNNYNHFICNYFYIKFNLLKNTIFDNIIYIKFFMEVLDLSNKKIEDIDLKIKQLKEQKQALLQREKEKERKARTKRLIEVGAIMDTLGIDSVELANEFKNHFINNEKSKLWLENFIQKNKA